MNFKRFFLVIFYVVLLIAPFAVHAQINEGIMPAKYQHLYQNFSQDQNDTDTDSVINAHEQARGKQYARADIITDDHRQNKRPLRMDDLRKITDAKPDDKKSALEKLYSERVVDDVTQYGYDLFGTVGSVDALNSSALPSGAVQDDFILGSGDELEVIFSGQRNDRKKYKINAQGMLIIDEFPPVPAAGRSMESVRRTIEETIKALPNTEVFVSLSDMRQIGVLVVGHVEKPGRQNLTVFHTVLDALMMADGVKKSGSLRQIKLIRGGRSMIVDIYGLLMNGSANMDINLRDGDRIVVPAIGPTVAVAGEVKRPGIFEILPVINGMHHEPDTRSEKLSLNDMLAFGGGVLSPGKNRFLKLEVAPDGRENVTEVHEAFAPAFGHGAILMISRGQEKKSGMVELSGHTLRPGMYALDETPTLSALLSSEDVLADDVYPLVGAIERKNPEQLSTEIMSYPLRLVLNGEYDRKLENGDIVHVFSMRDIEALQNGAGITENDADKTEQGSFNPDSNNTLDKTIASFLRERSVYMRGAVRNPGPYPVAEGTTLDSMIATAGGLTLEANTQNIEITSDQQGKGHQENGRSGTRRITVNFQEDNPADILLAAGDAVRINQKFKKVKDTSVLISGEVVNPGRYDLLPGDKLSDLLLRAGGFTEQAYPEGAIFSRDHERKAEEARFRAQARQMKQAVALALESKDENVNEAKIAEARALAAELENAEGIGRITVEADLDTLAVHPEMDILLEKSDRIYVPKRSLTVRVTGEVLSAAALQFREGKDPLDYIHEAGSFTFHADKERVFVLYPDGSAQPLQVSAWNHKATFIPPGSTIVVPRDPKPFDFVESAKDISQILSNLAITAIFIDDVRNN